MVSLLEEYALLLSHMVSLLCESSCFFSFLTTSDHVIVCFSGISSGAILTVSFPFCLCIRDSISDLCLDSFDLSLAEISFNFVISLFFNSISITNVSTWCFTACSKPASNSFCCLSIVCLSLMAPSLSLVISWSFLAASEIKLFICAVITVSNLLCDSNRIADNGGSASVASFSGLPGSLSR